MNLNLINLNPSEWSKFDWTDAYSQALLGDRCAGMSKQEYYNFVIANHKSIEERDKPLSDELKKQWTENRKSAISWMKLRDCNRDGVLTKDIKKDIYQEQIDDISSNMRVLEHNTGLTKSIALKAKKW